MGSSLFLPGVRFSWCFESALWVRLSFSLSVHILPLDLQEAWMGNILQGVIIDFYYYQLEAIIKGTIETIYLFVSITMNNLCQPKIIISSSISSHPLVKLQMIIYILISLLLLEARPQSFSIVEGFYWDQQKYYTHAQRRSLIQLMPKGSAYVYMPQLVDTLKPWNNQDLGQWQYTKKICSIRGIELTMGFRTMFIDNLENTLQRLQVKIKQLNLPFILGWDDCPGGLTDAQKKLQLQIIQKVSRKPLAVIPAAYYSQKGNLQKWKMGLNIINDADISIPFILTSKHGINPSSLDPLTDFPPLKRKMIFWDNWMAVDVLDRFPRNLPRNRSIKLFDIEQQYGYMLNLCFPPERIIHGLISIRYQQKGQNYDYNEIANIWTAYLLEHKFIIQSQVSEMKRVLWQLMYYADGTMQVVDLLKQYPILSSFLYV